MGYFVYGDGNIVLSGANYSDDWWYYSDNESDALRHARKLATSKVLDLLTNINDYTQRLVDLGEE